MVNICTYIHKLSLVIALNDLSFLRLSQISRHIPVLHMAVANIWHMRVHVAVTNITAHINLVYSCHKHYNTYPCFIWLSHASGTCVTLLSQISRHTSMLHMFVTSIRHMLHMVVTNITAHIYVSHGCHKYHDTYQRFISTLIHSPDADTVCKQTAPITQTCWVHFRVGQDILDKWKKFVVLLWAGRYTDYDIWGPAFIRLLFTRELFLWIRNRLFYA